MAVATYFYYEKVRKTMRTAIVSHLLNWSLLKKGVTETHITEFLFSAKEVRFTWNLGNILKK